MASSELVPGLLLDRFSGPEWRVGAIRDMPSQELCMDITLCIYILVIANGENLEQKRCSKLPK
jgi:hypothetical protein